MAVFDKETKIRTRVQASERESDNRLAGAGSLSWVNITTSQGVVGTVGIDAKLVHGTRFQQIEGRQWERIDSHLDTQVGGNQHIVIEGNVDHEIWGILTFDVYEDARLRIVGNTHSVHCGVSGFTFLGEMMETHGALKFVTQPRLFQTTGQELSNIQLCQSQVGTKIEIANTRVMSGSNLLIAYNSLNGLTSLLNLLTGRSAHIGPRVNAASTVSSSAPFGA